MSHFVALLRGIGPTNPNMRGEKLRRVFESLGFQNVRTVIASGNVLFETPVENIPALETKIEDALFTQLGFHSATIIRSREQLQKLVKQDPFRGLEHSRTSYLTVTFMKHPTKPKLQFPHRPEKKGWELLGYYDGAMCTVIDVETTGTPDFMTWFEKHFGKEITTRTWKTVEKIVAKLAERKV